jgi:hypothetical protein
VKQSGEKLIVKVRNYNKCTTVSRAANSNILCE